MMRDLSLYAAILALAMPVAEGRAEGAAKAPVVVELFTSQGCVACPPADVLLGELAQKPQVLPLALHVDYWDYIGWEDTFGSPAFTERQKAYARASGQRSIFTPQMVIGGSKHVVGFEPVEVARLIEAEEARPDAAEVQMSRKSGMLSVRLAPLAAPVGAAEVQLVRYLPQATVDILRGENAGKTMSYTNIVTDWQHIADWDGTAPLGLEVAVEGPAAIAVIVQSAGQGSVLGAARLD